MGNGTVVSRARFETVGRREGAFAGPGFDLPTIRPALWVFWSMCLTVTVLSLVALWRRSGTMRTRAYKSSVYFLWILFFSLLPLAAPGRAMTDLVLPAAPARRRDARLFQPPQRLDSRCGLSAVVRQRRLLRPALLGGILEAIVRPSPMAGRFFGLAVRPLNTKKVSDASS